MEKRVIFNISFAFASHLNGDSLICALQYTVGGTSSEKPVIELVL